MKYAVTTTGDTLDSPVDPRFGRAAGFLLVDPENSQVEYLPNTEAAQKAHGAGIAAAEGIVAAGATVLLTGRVGPQALRVLLAAGVAVGQDLQDMTVRQAVAVYRRGEADVMRPPSAPGDRQ